MNFEEYTTPLLKKLAHDLIENEAYGYLGNISNILVAFNSSRWEKLPSDEQCHWIKELSQMIGGRDGVFDCLGYENENLNKLLSALQVKEKQLKESL